MFLMAMNGLAPLLKSMKWRFQFLRKHKSIGKVNFPWNKNKCIQFYVVKSKKYSYLLNKFYIEVDNVLLIIIQSSPVCVCGRDLK